MLSAEHRPGKESRQQPLAEYVRTEIDELRSGQISRISTNDELRARFGYSRTTSLYPILRKHGLVEERRQIKEQGGQKEPIVPSQESAWMIGIIAGGGSNDLRTGAIVISEKDEGFLQTVKSTGERLFETRGNIHVLRTKEDGTTYKYVSFHDKDISRQLGDLRRDNWFQTVVDRHPWILRDDRYIASFLGGIFDTRGLIAPRQGIILLTSYPAIANFLSELLTRLGIENPRLRYKGKDKQKLIGVGIYGRKDIKIFADLIYSRKSEKEAKLEILREGETVKLASRATSEEDIINEWLRLREVFDHYPRSSEIARLKKLGQTKYSVTVYRNSFGAGSFVKARQRLESIINSQTGEQTEAPLPKIRVYARHTRGSDAETYSPREKLIEEYKRAREICLRDENRLPQICDIARLRDRGIVDYTAHTLAIYFGDRSIVKARENLERILAEREAANS